MISLLRKIRKSLIESGSAWKPASPLGRYLQYAIGEIALVVIGILIALQINNWNNERIDRKQEVNILKQLKDEYLGKQSELQKKKAMRTLMIRSADQLLEMIDEGNTKIEQDSLVKIVAYTTITPTFDASNSVTEELLNSGKLYIIQNDSLRKLILGWSSEINKLREEENNVVKILFDLYMPFLNSRVSYKDIANIFFLESGEIFQYITETGPKDVAILKKSRQAVDIRELFGSREFESLLSVIYFANNVINIQSEELNQYIHNTLTLINQELTEYNGQ